MRAHMFDVDLIQIVKVLAFVAGFFVCMVGIVRFFDSRFFALVLGRRVGPKFAMRKHLGVRGERMSILDVEMSAAFFDDIGLLLARLQKELGSDAPHLQPIELSPPPDLVLRSLMIPWMTLSALSQLSMFGKSPPLPSRQVELEPGRFEVIRDQLYLWKLDGVPVVVMAAMRGDYDS